MSTDLKGVICIIGIIFTELPVTVMEDSVTVKNLQVEVWEAISWYLVWSASLSGTCHLWQMRGRGFSLDDDTL